MSNPAVQEIVTAAAEAIEDVAIRRIGRDLGTVHRDEIVGAGVVAALRVAAEWVDRGPDIPLPPSIISAVLRERADDVEAATRE